MYNDWQNGCGLVIGCYRFLNMPENKNFEDSLFRNASSNRYNPPFNPDDFLDHWALKLYSYTFVTLFGALAVIIFIAFVQQWVQAVRNRNIHGRFTTVELLLAAALKFLRHLITPLFLQDAPKEIFMATLFIESFSEALILSAFSIRLLILLETTKTSLTAPKLQNIWVLLCISAIFAAILLVFSLLVFYGFREIWYLLSNTILFILGIAICIGYIVAGYRMWRNLKSSRQLRRVTGEPRLKHIIRRVFVSACLTALMIILDLLMAAKIYRLYSRRRVTRASIWSTYAVMFLEKSVEFSVMSLIFWIVVWAKVRGRSVNEAPAITLGTFTECTVRNHKGEERTRYGEDFQGTQL